MKEITPKEAIVAMLAMRTIVETLLPISKDYVPMREFNRHIIPVDVAKNTLEILKDGIPNAAKKEILQNFFTSFLWFTTLMGIAHQANRKAVDEFLKDNK